MMGWITNTKDLKYAPVPAVPGYPYYREVFRGNAIPEGEFTLYIDIAHRWLAMRLTSGTHITARERDEIKMATCALAEIIREKGASARSVPAMLSAARIYLRRTGLLDVNRHA